MSETIKNRVSYNKKSQCNEQPDLLIHAKIQLYPIFSRTRSYDVWLVSDFLMSNQILTVHMVDVYLIV